MTGNSDPLGEFMQGEEACAEVHTFFGGLYARWNGRGPYEIPEGVSEEEKKILLREVAYYRLGWWICDVVLKVIEWIKRRYPILKK